MNADLEVSFPPVPPLDSAGAPSRASVWCVYVNGELKETDIPISASKRSYTISEYRDYDVQVSLVNEMGEGALSAPTTVSHAQPKGLPSQPGAPGVTLILAGGSIGGGTSTPTGDGQVELSWGLVNEYTDNSLMIPKSFKIKYGTSSGSYTNEIDTINDTVKMPLERTITDLQAGTRYYFVVSPMDSEGNEGANSAEVNFVAAAADTSLPTADFTITSAPYTISSPGKYQITQNLSAGGSAIQLASGVDDVEIFADPADNLTVTYSTSSSGAGIESLGGSHDNLRISGFSITDGGNTSGNTACIDLNNSGSSMTNLDIDGITFNIGTTDEDPGNRRHVLNCNSLSTFTGRMRNCTWELRGYNWYGIRFDGSSNSFRLLNSTINAGYAYGSSPSGDYCRMYYGGFQGKDGISEIGGCTFNITNFTSSSGQGQTNFPGGNSFIHDCQVNVSGSTGIRMWIPDDASGNTFVHMGMDIVTGDTVPNISTNNRLWRQRVTLPGGNVTGNHRVGFITATCETDAPARALCMQIGGDNLPSSQGASDSVYCDIDIEGWNSGIGLEGHHYDLAFWRLRLVGNNYGITCGSFENDSSGITINQSELEGGISSVLTAEPTSGYDFCSCTQDDGVTAITRTGDETANYNMSSTSCPVIPNKTPKTVTGLAAA